MLTSALWRLTGLAVLTILGLGCNGDGRLKIYPVNGQVLYNGEPLPGVDVAFHPVDARNDTSYPPHATTDSNGKFALTTYLKDDGAPAGEFAVAIAFAVETAGDDDGADQTRKLTFQVPARYHRKETSGIAVTIKPESNTLEPFALTGPGRPKSRR